jgi:hypothetical protein
MRMLTGHRFLRERGVFCANSRSYFPLNTFPRDIRRGARVPNGSKKCARPPVWSTRRNFRPRENFQLAWDTLLLIFSSRFFLMRAEIFFSVFLVDFERDF